MPIFSKLCLGHSHLHALQFSQLAPALSLQLNLQHLNLILPCLDSLLQRKHFHLQRQTFLLVQTTVQFIRNLILHLLLNFRHVFRFLLRLLLVYVHLEQTRLWRRLWLRLIVNMRQKRCVSADHRILDGRQQFGPVIIHNLNKQQQLPYSLRYNQKCRLTMPASDANPTAFMSGKQRIRIGLQQLESNLHVSIMLKSFDFFRKIRTDQQLTSATGGLFTIIALIFAGLLILMSFQDFYQLKYYTFLAVKNDNSDYLPMRIDILFSKMPCEAISIEFKDELQYVESDLEKKLTLYHLNADGREQPYNRSQDRQTERSNLNRHIMEQYKCRAAGILPLPKTPGTISFNANAQNNIMNEIDRNIVTRTRMSYRINSLNFGMGNSTFDFPIAHKSKNIQNYIKDLEGNFSSRQYVQSLQSDDRFNYFNHLKIIPVIIESADNSQQNSENYRYSLRSSSVWSNEPTQQIMFMTEIEPINIVYKKHEPRFYDLLLEILAIVGGTVATIGIFNSLSHYFLNIK